MRKYKGGQLDCVICNCCGKKLVVKDGILREGAVSFEHCWDYSSEKDGEIHRFDLCEECYDAVISAVCHSRGGGGKRGASLKRGAPAGARAFRDPRGGPRLHPPLLCDMISPAEKIEMK